MSDDPSFPTGKSIPKFFFIIGVSTRVVFMSSCKIRLYVESTRTVVGTIEAEHEIFGRTTLEHPDRIKIEGKITDGTFRLRQFAVETEPRYDYVLSEDQQKVAEMVKSIACKHGLEVEVVDVAKENVLRRIVQKERDRICVFPTLIALFGGRIEGKITEKQVEELLSDTLTRGKRRLVRKETS